MSRTVLLLILLVVVLQLARALAGRVARAARPPAPARWDPWAVLGVARGATRDEIAQAYRDQLKRYHPDRVADLGPELQRIAHQKTIELQRAYDELTR